MGIIDPRKLLETLCLEPREREWLEFKHNKFEAEVCGEYISALANAAILANQPHAYLVFGVENKTHKIVGTTVRLREEKIGNEPFEPWVSRLLDPRLSLQFLTFTHNDAPIEMIVIDPAYQRPVRFKANRFIRVDSQLRNLKDYAELERTLWSLTSRFAFEQGIASTHLSRTDILKQFECEILLATLGQKAASDDVVIDQLLMRDLIINDKQGGYDVTNLLVLACAKNLKNFPSVAEKAPRVIRYKGKSKLETDTDQEGGRGLVVGFKPMLKYIMDRVPHREEMRQGQRETIYSFPELAVRELVANALIHQDFTLQGGRPTIEIFDDRMQITNPGEPLIPPERFIDAPAKSRNERFSELMRQIGLCEKRGSGIDRALDAIEAEALPPPLIQVVEQNTVVTMFRERAFADMTREERIRACYQHTCLKFEFGDQMSNGSLRLRFGLKQTQYPQVSNVINDTINAGLIKPMNADQANRHARYVPHYT